jgi:hypothetical protein
MVAQTRKAVWCWLAVVFASLTGTAVAADKEQGEQQITFLRPPPETPPTYCGVCSLYRALQAMEKEVPFESLLRPEYISTTQGSSVNDLIRAAEDQGLLTKFLGRMNCWMLKETESPVILHVKSALGPTPFNHWILFAGTEGGDAVIYDGTNAPALVPFDELAVQRGFR